MAKSQMIYRGTKMPTIIENEVMPNFVADEMEDGSGLSAILMKNGRDTTEAEAGIKSLSHRAEIRAARRRKRLSRQDPLRPSTTPVVLSPTA